MTPSRDISRLLEIMEMLRDPQTGCSWDVEQTFETIAPYTIEEAYEVAEAIRRKDPVELCQELGDLLLQVVFHAQMAREAGQFSFEDVVQAITEKMIRRHPHVFGTREQRARGIQPGDWERIKSAEKAELKAARQAAGIAEQQRSLLDDVPVALPGLARAVKLQKAASRVGFDWNDPRAVLSKIREEIDELEAEINSQPTAVERIEDELGDILFAVANLARHMRVEPEAALERSNQKFQRRFAVIEHTLQEHGLSLEQATPEQMEQIWVEAKTLEKPRKDS